MYKMGTDDGSTGLPETNKIRDHSDAVGVDNKIDNNKSSPGSSSINVDSNIDDYIESLCMLVMTRRQDTNALFSKPEISQPVRRLSDKTKPSGIIFISKKEDMTWFASAKRFDDLTKYTGGLLQRSRFSECIAMNKISEDFAAELFDALCLRNNIKGDSINKGELHEFWYQIIDKSFDSRLQPFIYMMDKDQDGRITQDDVRKIISLSASTNNLSNIKNQAEEYAAFIIEELDLDELGYITINNLEMLLLHAPQNDKRVESQKLRTRQSGNTIRRWYEDFSTYGAPAQDYKTYEVVLLVGSGTPIINIVKDMLNNIKAKEDEDNTGKLQKNKSWPTNFNTTRAYLYWVTSEQGSFDRFKDIINEAAEMDKYGVIELHAYCTSVFEEDDIRSAFITILQSLYYARNGIDVVSGTRVKSRFAEPNWRYLYKQIALSHTGSRIGVFYCGEPAPAKELKQLAHDFSHSTTTKFDFHKQI